MWRAFVVLVFFLASPGYADIYQCVNEGKTIFSQIPCAPDAVLLQPKVYSPSAQSLREQQQRHKSLQTMSKSIDRDYNMLLLQRRMSDLDASIAALLRERDQRIAELRAQAAQARPGRAAHRDLSMQISSLREQYNTQIDMTRAERRYAEQEYSRLQRGR